MRELLPNGFLLWNTDLETANWAKHYHKKAQKAQEAEEL
jgi:hypothetical protein